MRGIISTFILILFIGFKFTAFAQEEDSSYVRTDRPSKTPTLEEGQKEQTPVRDKIFIGVYPGFSWSNYGFSYEVSPLVGIDVFPRLALGVGAVYKHSDSKGYSTLQGIVPSYKADFVGFRTFGYFDVYKNFCAYAEYEGLSIRYRNDFGSFDKWQPAAKVGLLYKSPFSDRVAANFLVLYNLFYDDYETIGGSPLDIRIGIVFYPFKSKSY